MSANVVWRGLGWGICIAAGFFLVGPGCGGDSGDDEGAGGSGATNGDASATGGSSGAGNTSATGGTAGSTMTGTDGNTYSGHGCLNGTTQCTNCIDDDIDGLIDSLDPECSGPVDNDEGSFATGIPGDNIDFCQDCFFDGDSGQGNDGCAYHTDCLSGSDPGGGGDCMNCSVSDQCVNFCMQYTPNGCDCFGCCAIQDEGGTTHTVLLDADCTVDDLGDDAKCKPCVQSTECVNDCGRCELCIGKETLPDDCYTGGSGGSGGAGTAGAAGAGGYGGGQVCSGGQQVCNTSTPCPAGEYCLTGCCITQVK